MSGNNALEGVEKKHTEATRDEILGIYREMVQQPAAKEAGRCAVLGWDLEYLCGGAIGSFIDQLLIRQLNDFIPANDQPVILDCGANIGFSVLNYKRKFSKSKITAFEPDPQFVPLLRRNLERNGVLDVKIVDAAAWIKDGEAKWHCEGTDGSRLAQSEEELRSCVIVRTVDLARYLNERIDLLKMDIEGSEYDVIAHLGNGLANVQNLCIECHVDQRKIHALGKLLECLSREGFNVGINSFGPWRDLIRQPAIPADHWGQYLIVTGWRGPIAAEQSSSQVLPYLGAKWLQMESDLEVAGNELQQVRRRLEESRRKSGESQRKCDELQAELGRYQSSWLCRLVRKLKH